ncbi:hypothetical protein FB451DRAFT_1202253 [Mycena latifolia]|nr:hypothetical protein FB451DRAFT_1202253 [Mycena latifolia]
MSPWQNHEHHIPTHPTPSSTPPPKEANFLIIGQRSSCPPNLSHTYHLLSTVVAGFADPSPTSPCAPIRAIYDALLSIVTVNLMAKYPSKYAELAKNLDMRKTFLSYILRPMQICISDFVPSEAERFAWGITNDDVRRIDEIGYRIPALRADLCRAYDKTFSTTSLSPELRHRRAQMGTMIGITLAHELCHSWLRTALDSCGLPPQWITPSPDSEDPGGQSGRQLELQLFGGVVLVIWRPTALGNFLDIDEIGISPHVSPTLRSPVRFLAAEVIERFHTSLITEGLTFQNARTFANKHGIPGNDATMLLGEVQKDRIIARWQIDPASILSGPTLPPGQLERELELYVEKELELYADDGSGSCRLNRVVLSG